MVVYWGMLIWVFLLGVSKPDEHNPLKSNTAIAYQATWQEAFLLMLPVIFFAMFRCAPIDTASYIWAFKRMPDDMVFFKEWLDAQKGSQLFHGLQMIFKNYIADSPTMWLSLLALVQGLVLVRFFQKYSVNVAMTVFIFIGSTLFTWMYNGIRQFTAVTILVGLTECIIKNRWYIYLPVALVLAGSAPIWELFGIETTPWFLDGIHQSALLMIPLFFFVQGKPLNWKMILFAVVFAALIVSGGMDSLLGSAVEVADEYKDDMQYVEESVGANPIRSIVALAPVVMFWIKRKEIMAMDKTERPPFIDLSINMSLMTLMVHVASIFTSGMYVGRLPIYTELYNLILIPWLIMVPYKRDKKMLTQVVCAAYLLWFVYQLQITWGGLSYASDVLHLYLWGATR